MNQALQSNHQGSGEESERVDVLVENYMKKNTELYDIETLRASVCKYRKPGASCEIFNSFIFCLNKPFSELFSKIQLKVPRAL